MFYVYQYLRENGTPYYVGKGSGDRAWKKWSKKDIKPPQDSSRIIIVRDGLNEQEAFDLEKNLISEYGRKDLGTGILHNKTDGGEGSSGHKIGGWKWSEESKAKRRGAGNPAFGKPSSEKQKITSSLVHKGRVHSNESKQKRSEVMQGRFVGKKSPLYGKKKNS